MRQEDLFGMSMIGAAAASHNAEVPMLPAHVTQQRSQFVRVGILQRGGLVQLGMALR